MKLLRIIAVYSRYAEQFYAARPGLAEQSYAAQKRSLDQDHFGVGNSLSNALEHLGYEVTEVYPTIEPLQGAWRREHGLKDGTPEDCVVTQAKQFQPEVIYFEFYDAALLQRIRSEVPSVRLVLGWEGSALSTGRAWRKMDCILSCAPESVERLRALGFTSELIGHAFDPQINSLLAPTHEPIVASFIGSIVRRNQFHIEREKILLALVKKVPVQIFSPTLGARWQDYVKVAAAGGAYVGIGALKAARLSDYVRRHSQLVRTAERVASAPRRPVNPALAKYMQPGVYGLKFYQTIHDSEISINIHADSSPKYASNMRLYEATGVGSCLLTDWRPNLKSLFDTDREVVSYASAEEAVEKALWLLEHPAERSEIARRGQARTLRNYTFANQAQRLDEIIRENLAMRSETGSRGAASRSAVRNQI